MARLSEAAKARKRAADMARYERLKSTLEGYEKIRTWRRNADSKRPHSSKRGQAGDRVAKHRQYAYGITSEQYEEMRRLQNYECAICFASERSQRHGRLSIDHDHNTGKVRGLLCSACNGALGLFFDNPDLLKFAIEYLVKNGRCK